MPAYEGMFPSFEFPDFDGLEAPCRGHGKLFHGNIEGPHLLKPLTKEAFPDYTHPREVCLALCPRQLARQCLGMAMADPTIPLGTWGATTKGERTSFATRAAAQAGFTNFAKLNENEQHHFYAAAAGAIIDATLPLEAETLPDTTPAAQPDASATPPPTPGQNPPQPLA